MTQSNNIQNSWSLLAFAKHFDSMKVAPFKDGAGDTFKACVFDKAGELTFVSFSKNLGELTPRQIANMKHDLQVVQCLTSGGKPMYSLCKKGSDAWETVDLGI